ncbi:uncharacterized protein LOC110019002 [Phalaenopsis equestris]|uniref:uncharacterized protein LOC110019002 n=1 Tax=Phalaenopsis equestris TaxID=78828 RepID=UPI0009E3C710|nr:uncharacterized protein LOC110019002 [Phalaenopsis equestris]XP_020572178.1 uncharacterized protein LOC110019002 [Phalaenopsis equestris]
MAGRDEEEFGRKKMKMGKEIDGKWPTVKPKKDLKVNRLKSTHLFTISNFLTAYEAKTFIEVAELIGFVHQGSLGPTKGEAYRDNDRISVNDPILAESLWESGLNKVFDDIKLYGKAAVGLNPNIRFYRYKVGQMFGRHIDESVELEQGGRTYYTLLVYLSGVLSPKGKANLGTNDSSMQPLAGGETVFYDQRHGVVAEVSPHEGMALLHLHGAKCMLHEARSVTKGIKYVLRSDVAFA